MLKITNLSILAPVDEIYQNLVEVENTCSVSEYHLVHVSIWLLQNVLFGAPPGSLHEKHCRIVMLCSVFLKCGVHL